MISKIMRIGSVLVVIALIMGVTLTAQNKIVFAVTEGEVSIEGENTFALCHDGQDNDGDLAADATDSECSAHQTPPAQPENTEALCKDDIDNDSDLLTDFTDGDCAPFAESEGPETPSENNQERCTDKEDNDGDLLTDATDPECAIFNAAPEATSTPETESENTLEVCQDDIDNDLDLLTDLTDSDCAPFAFLATSTPTSTPGGVENTQPLCTDGQDNDGDLLTDATDPDCSAFATTTPPTEDNGNGGGGSPAAATPSGGGFSSFSSFSGGLPNNPSVLGASTGPTGSTCGPVLLDYMKMGKNNSSTEVKKLQVILNSFLGLKLPINGVFGPETDAAVRQLQLKYSADILMPWVNAGLMPGGPMSTGYVFKTTKTKINNLLCGGNVFPIPMLP